MDQREHDDPSPYLLAIWAPGKCLIFIIIIMMGKIVKVLRYLTNYEIGVSGETAESTQPPEICCNSQDTGELCNKEVCFACNSIREARTQTVRATLLVVFTNFP